MPKRPTIQVQMDGYEGYEAFFAANYVLLVRTLWSYGGDRDVAEEAAQEAFVRASRDWRRVSAMQSKPVPAP